MIRIAHLEDVPRLVELGQRFRQESAYADTLRENPTQMAAIAERLIMEPAGHVVVDEHESEIVGMLGLYVYEHPISGDRMAIEVFWYVVPQHRGAGLAMLYRARAWAREQGATVLQMIAPGPDIERMYQRLGFTKVETTYQRAL